MNEWIVVPNWDRFQHYGLRRLPAWIKIYTSLNSHDAWNELTFAERGLLVTIWLEYARSKRRLTVGNLPRNVTQKVHKRSLDALNHAGFIHFAASPEVELELEEELLGTNESYVGRVVGVTNSRANQTAYTAGNGLSEDITIDQAALEQAKQWLANQSARRPKT
jgi:hypothetical protein